MRLLAGVDLRRDFFFSYTYPLTSSLQDATAGRAGCPWSSPFCWNAHLARPLAACLGGLSSTAMRRWLLPLIHGSFGATSLALCGTPVSVVLLARRSRRFAGTRYRKRGVNDAGDVANHVETEQVVDAGAWPCRRQPRGVRRDYPPYSAIPPPPPPRCSSVLQVRGSIPLFWSQEASALSPKPDILLARHDPYYGATKEHFAQLQARYGDCVALSLVKASEKRPRETLLRRELGAAVDAINAAAAAAGEPPAAPRPPHVVLCSWDFSRRAKRSRPADVLCLLNTLSTGGLAKTGIFVTPRPVDLGAPPRSQASSVAAQAATAALGWTAPAGEAAPRRMRPDEVARRAFLAAGAESVLGLDNDDDDSDGDAAGHGPWLLSSEGDPFAGGCRQVGVLRTNCIDCLDRTNVAQFAYGVAALGMQLVALGLGDEAALAADSPLVESLSLLYQHMGDALAWQYGGSDSHSHMLQAAASAAAGGAVAGAGQAQQLLPAAGGYAAGGHPGAVPPAAGPLGAGVGGVAAWRAAGNYSRQWLTSAQRFYSATITDAEKQDAINLFLGHFVPQRGRPALWELDNDVWLHARAQRGEEDGGGGRDPTAWAALDDGRRSPFGRAALSDAQGSLASFDVWAEPPPGWAPVPPAVRVYPPGVQSGYTAPVRPARRPGTASQGDAGQAAVQARRAAAAVRARSFYAATVARSILPPGPGLGLATPTEQQAAVQRYAPFCTDTTPWAALFAGAAEARLAAERGRQDVVMDPASLAAFEQADRAALDLLRASAQQASEVAAADALPDATLSAAQAFLSAPDDLAPVPEWTMPVGQHEVAAPRWPSDEPTAGKVTAPVASHKYPPPPGSDLRRWLAAREAGAWGDMEEAVLPAASLGRLGRGVLLPAPLAANAHAMARAQLAQLIAPPLFEDRRKPEARALRTPSMRRFSGWADRGKGDDQGWGGKGDDQGWGGKGDDQGWAFHAFHASPADAYMPPQTLLTPPPAVVPATLPLAQPVGLVSPEAPRSRPPARHVPRDDDDAYFSTGDRDAGPKLGSLMGMMA